MEYNNLKNVDEGKIREFSCDVCGKKYLRRATPSDIKRSKNKVCSKECSNKLNGINKRTGWFETCVICSKDFWVSPSVKKWHKNKRVCTMKCLKKRPVKGKRVDGLCLSTDGYVLVRVMKRVIKKHRHLMEQKIGRKLLSKEIVHHIDFNKLNNDISNLQLVSRAEHNRIHFKKMV